MTDEILEIIIKKVSTSNANEVYRVQNIKQEN